MDFVICPKCCNTVICPNAALLWKWLFAWRTFVQNAAVLWISQNDGFCDLSKVLQYCDLPKMLHYYESGYSHGTHFPKMLQCCGLPKMMDCCDLSKILNYYDLPKMLHNYESGYLHGAHLPKILHWYWSTYLLYCRRMMNTVRMQWKDKNMFVVLIKVNRVCKLILDLLETKGALCLPFRFTWQYF